jgi:hypothetical protein
VKLQKLACWWLAKSKLRWTKLHRFFSPRDIFAFFLMSIVIITPIQKLTALPGSGTHLH